MVKLGVMLYGYDEANASDIHAYLEKAAGQEVVLVSGSGKEGQRVQPVIELPTADFFEDKPTKILMFLGFPNDVIGPAMKFFPESVERPIFCALTQQNLTWTLEYLIEHLLEERERMSGK